MVCRSPVGSDRGFVVEGPVLAGLSVSHPSPLALGTALAEITKTASGTPSWGRSCSPKRRVGREHGALVDSEGLDGRELEGLVDGDMRGEREPREPGIAIRTKTTALRGRL